MDNPGRNILQSPVYAGAGGWVGLGVGVGRHVGVGVGGGLGGHQRGNVLLHRDSRYSEIQPFTISESEGVDAQNLAGHRKRRPAAVAEVDSGVSLDYLAEVAGMVAGPRKRCPG